MQHGAHRRVFYLWVNPLSDQQLLGEARVCYLTRICGFSCKMEELTATKEKPPRKGISERTALESSWKTLHVQYIVCCCCFQCTFRITAGFPYEITFESWFLK